MKAVIIPEENVIMRIRGNHLEKRNFMRRRAAPKEVRTIIREVFIGLVPLLVLRRAINISL